MEASQWQNTCEMLWVCFLQKMISYVEVTGSLFRLFHSGPGHIHWAGPSSRWKAASLFLLFLHLGQEIVICRVRFQAQRGSWFSSQLWSSRWVFTPIKEGNMDAYPTRAMWALPCSTNYMTFHRRQDGSLLWLCHSRGGQDKMCKDVQGAERKQGDFSSSVSLGGTMLIRKLAPALLL